MPQFGASLADDSRVVIYDYNMFIVQATGFVLQAKICSRYDVAENATTNKRSSLLRRQKLL